MKFHIRFRNIPDSVQPTLTEELEALAKKRLERHVAKFTPDLVQLHIVLERSSHRSYLYRVALRLTVPGGFITSQKTGESPTVAAKSAFDELERQLIEHLERMRGEDEWRRKERREQLHRLKAAASERPPKEREVFRKALRPHLPTIRRFVRFELSHLQARGELKPDQITVDEVIDEALARTFRERDERSDPDRIVSRVLKSATDVLTEEAAQSRKRARRLSLEGPPPRAPDDISIDETIFDFYQPDDLLKVEDLVAAPSPDPEELVSEREIQHGLASIIASMPNIWRRAFILARVQGMPLPTVAHVLGSSETQVREWLERANTFLKARLAELGIEGADKKLPAGSANLARTPATPELEAEFDRTLNDAS